MLTSSSTHALVSALWCTRHPFSEPDQAVMAGLRAATGPNKAPAA
jgi:hypothetical protein